MPTRHRVTAPPPAAPPAPAPALKYLVYTIEDPTTDAILYVGATGRTVDRRMREHMIEALVDLDGDPQAWALRELVYGASGMPAVRPRVREIARYATRAEAEAAEKSYIKAFRAAGHPLTNALLRDEPPPPPGPVTAPPAVRILGSAPAPAAPTRQWRSDVGAEGSVTAVRPPSPTPQRRAGWLWPLAGWASALLGVSVVVLVLAGRTLVPATAASLGPPDPAGPPAPAAPPQLAPPPVAPQSPVSRGETHPGATAQPPTIDYAVSHTALEPPAARPTPGPERVGSTSLVVAVGDSFAAVADRLGWTPAELAAHLGRSEVYAGEEIVRPLYAGDPKLSQGGAPPAPPVDPAENLHQQATEGRCPDGRPKDGRLDAPFLPGCAPVPRPAAPPGAGAPARERQPAGGGGPVDVPGPPAPPALYPFGPTPTAVPVDTLTARVAQPEGRCPDGTMRDLAKRTRSPFLPGCAPVAAGP